MLTALERIFANNPTIAAACHWRRGPAARMENSGRNLMWVQPHESDSNGHEGGEEER